MSITIDASFDVYSDTPSGKDPDSHSPTLRSIINCSGASHFPTGRNSIYRLKCLEPTFNILQTWATSHFQAMRWERRIGT